MFTVSRKLITQLVGFIIALSIRNKEMELSWATSSAIILITVTFGLVYAWRALNWMWLKPKKMEKLLTEQGLQGNPYRLLLGDAKDYFVMQKKVQSKPMNLSDDIAPRVAPYIHHAVQTHGIFVFSNSVILQQY